MIGLRKILGVAIGLALAAPAGPVFALRAMNAGMEEAPAGGQIGKALRAPAPAPAGMEEQSAVILSHTFKSVLDPDDAAGEYGAFKAQTLAPVLKSHLTEWAASEFLSPDYSKSLPAGLKAAVLRIIRLGGTVEVRRTARGGGGRRFVVPVD